MLQPTWDMGRSTILYTCNKTGLHNVSEAIRYPSPTRWRTRCWRGSRRALRYGVAAYDWSNAKELWSNAQPMDADRMLTKQAELVLAADPGIEGEQPRVWVYREHTTTAYSLSICVEVWVAFFSRSDDHLDLMIIAGCLPRWSSFVFHLSTRSLRRRMLAGNKIKALNWFGNVREKLDDPQFAGWFIKFKDCKMPLGSGSPAVSLTGKASHHFRPGPAVERLLQCPRVRLVRQRFAPSQVSDTLS